MADQAGQGNQGQFHSGVTRAKYPLAIEAVEIGTVEIDNNSPRWVRWACLPVLVLICGMTLGCGGDDTPPPRAAAPAKPTPPKPKPAPKKVAEPAEEDADEQEAGDADSTDADSSDTEPSKVGAKTGKSKPNDKKKASQKEPAKPEVPQRPKALEEWKVEHYLSAKKDKDRKLEEAVLLMGQKFSGNAKAASLFKQLLVIDHVPAEEKADGTFGKPTVVAVSRPVADALILGLSNNKTPESTQILKDVMLGKLETPIASRQAVTIVLAEMVNHMDYPENEEFIFGLLTKPDETLGGVVLSPEAPITNERLRTELLGLLSTKSTPNFNMRLAKYLEDPEVTKALASDIESMLMRDRPDTLLAKLVLYQNDQAEVRTKNAAETAMLDRSEEALEILLGIPPKLDEMPSIGAVSRPTVRQKGRSEEDIATVLGFAAKCWSPEIEAFLAARIAKQGDVANSPGPVQLIGTMPTAQARMTMNELIQTQAKEGSRGFNSAGLFGRNTMDPAFVIMAKSVYHGSPRRGIGAPDQEARDGWRDAMEPLIQGWIRRFYTAARNSTSEDWQAAKDSGNFKVVLHKDAQVVTEYHLLWPGEAQSKIPDVNLGPLEIHYVRIEEEGVPDKLANHYKRYGSSGTNAAKHEVRNGEWFDELQSGAAPKSKRSIDVMISHKAIPEEKSTPGVVSQAKSVPLVIDILTIEVPDPASK